MAFLKVVALALAAASSLNHVAGQFSSCPQPKSNVISLHISPGYALTKLVDGLEHPRQLVTDAANNLVVSSLGDGIIGLKIAYDGAGCPSVAEKKVLVPDNGQNFTHAVLLSPDGKTLFASTPEFVFAWDYDAHKVAVTGMAKTIVKGMFISATTLSITRALAIPKEHPGKLMAFRGSEDDKDYSGADPTKGFSEIKLFDWQTAPAGGYDFTKDGEVFAHGIRDTTDFIQDRAGDFWSIDNGADGVPRGGKPVGAPGDPNPADELNFLGKVRPGTPAEKTPNTGFPYCHTVWNGTALPNNPEHLRTGQVFAIDNGTQSDAQCNSATVRPRLSMPAHVAVLGLRFYRPDKSALGPQLEGAAFITYHGPTGKKVVFAPFQDGEPTAPRESTNGLTDFIWTDPAFNLTTCRTELTKNGPPCFSPVGLEYDCEGTLFVTSDLTGEVFAVTKDKKRY